MLYSCAALGIAANCLTALTYFDTHSRPCPLEMPHAPLA